MKNRTLTQILLMALASGLRAAPVDYGILTKALAPNVTAGRVNYPALKQDPRNLDRFLDQAATVTRPEFGTWDAAGKKAFLIDVYNASTLRLVLDHYPVRSIKDIGPFYSTPWKLDTVRVLGGLKTLDEIEKMLRNLGDPRIHFAIVCASKSCPNLAAVAYTPENLEPMLEADAKAFLSDPRRNRYDAARNVLLLSPIFDWYGKDFDAVGGVRAFVARHASSSAMAKAALDDVPIEWTFYDWTLNGKEASANDGKRP